MADSSEDESSDSSDNLSVVSDEDFVVSSSSEASSGELRNGSSLHVGLYDLILFFPLSSFILLLDRCV